MKNMIKRGCLALAGILFLLFLYQFNQIEKSELLETEGRNFEKAEVVEILTDNETENGNIIGTQQVKVKILTGAHKGEEVEGNSSASYLFGAHCEVGMKVVVILSESDNTIIASVYSVNREPAIYLMIAAFILITVLIGGKKGLSSIAALIFTLICVLFLFLPMIYKGISPTFSAVVVVVITTVATMYLIDGLSRKSCAAMLGTVIGVVAAGGFAWIFGKVTQISGYNVSDIENLVYVEEKTNIQIGELLFAGILIAALGAVMDVGMSISSTIYEIHVKNTALTARELFKSGMNVGKDMMGTMSNTLILAFTGGSLNTLVFIYAYNYQYRQIINMYSVGIELMQGISASLGVILTVPFTSLIAAYLITWKRKDRSK
ncbi:MAG: YibE/F family protein [Lachnospiraceae bacterium]|nr:YibE/F family protein [Lachnospiraceae bacterium]